MYNIKIMFSRMSVGSKTLPLKSGLWLVYSFVLSCIWTLLNDLLVHCCVAVYLFRLLYAGHRLMGVNCVTSQGWQLHTPKVCLLDPAARTLRTMNIPFHLALRLLY